MNNTTVEALPDDWKGMDDFARGIDGNRLPATAALAGTRQVIETDGGWVELEFLSADRVRWAEDGRALFVFKRNEIPARVFRLDVESGRRTPWLELMPADPAGVDRIPTVVLSPDGKSYAYSFTRELADLYLIRGLR